MDCLREVADAAWHRQTNHGAFPQALYTNEPLTGLVHSLSDLPDRLFADYGKTWVFSLMDSKGCASQGETEWRPVKTR
jgi:hypothetical protein